MNSLQIKFLRWGDPRPSRLSVRRRSRTFGTVLAFGLAFWTTIVAGDYVRLALSTDPEWNSFGWLPWVPLGVTGTLAGWIAVWGWARRRWLMAALLFPLTQAAPSFFWWILTLPLALVLCAVSLAAFVNDRRRGRFTQPAAHAR